MNHKHFGPLLLSVFLEPASAPLQVHCTTLKKVLPSLIPTELVSLWFDVSPPWSRAPSKLASQNVEKIAQSSLHFTGNTEQSEQPQLEIHSLSRPNCNYGWITTRQFVPLLRWPTRTSLPNKREDMNLDGTGEGSYIATLPCFSRSQNVILKI